MKAPNGSGTVYKMTGRRRNPWRAQYCMTDASGIRHRVTVGYYPTKKDGLFALSQFADTPYDIETGRKPFSDIYQMWYAEKFACGGNSNTVKNYLVAFNHCAALHKKPMNEIRLKDIQTAMDAQGSRDSAKRVQNLVSQMFDYCIKHEILKKNYAKDAVIRQKSGTKIKKNVYTEEELAAVRAVIDTSGNELLVHAAKMVLMLCYSGLRIGEFTALEKENTFLDAKTPYIYIDASKTDNGIREVPIHSSVLPYWLEFRDRSVGTRTICTTSGQMMSYDNFKRVYLAALNKYLGQSHTAHECRHTLISRASVAGCNLTAVQFIVGHSSELTLTEATYTHFTVAQLSAELEKMK